MIVTVMCQSDMEWRIKMQITETGNYITRSGLKVEVHEIKNGTATFPVKGSICRKPKTGNSKRIIREFSIWKRNGQHMAVGNHPLDIIKKQGE